jgi:hypothetical protein
VLFLDTDAVLGYPLESRSRKADSDDAAAPHLEGSDGKDSTTTSSFGSLVNETEATIVATLVHGILAAGGKPDDVGVISPYRSQLRLLRQVVDTFPVDATVAGAVRSRVEVDTVDRYQGRDKPVIVMSLVRSNEGGELGALLQDVRRLNVAFTRAKHKLLLVGSRNTLAKGSPVLRQLLELLGARQWVLPLPKGGHELYHAPRTAIATATAAPVANVPPFVIQPGIPQHGGGLHPQQSVAAAVTDAALKKSVGGVVTFAAHEPSLVTPAVPLRHRSIHVANAVAASNTNNVIIGSASRPRLRGGGYAVGLGSNGSSDFMAGGRSTGFSRGSGFAAASAVKAGHGQSHGWGNSASAAAADTTIAVSSAVAVRTTGVTYATEFKSGRDQPLGFDSALVDRGRQVFADITLETLKLPTGAAAAGGNDDLGLPVPHQGIASSISTSTASSSSAAAFGAATAAPNAAACQPASSVPARGFAKAAAVEALTDVSRK